MKDGKIQFEQGFGYAGMKLRNQESQILTSDSRCGKWAKNEVEPVVKNSEYIQGTLHNDTTNFVLIDILGNDVGSFGSIN
jgi:hypothetical protein